MAAFRFTPFRVRGSKDEQLCVWLTQRKEPAKIQSRVMASVDAKLVTRMSDTFRGVSERDLSSCFEVFKETSSWKFDIIFIRLY